MRLIKSVKFSNGVVHCLELFDGKLIETTDTFLPYYTKFLTSSGSNKLETLEIGSRAGRWMIGVSVMSGCPVRCGFCATGGMGKFRNLTADEIIDQVRFNLQNNPTFEFSAAKEHKINYTRMGEPFLNIEAVRKTVEEVNKIYPNTHHYISTIGINGSDFSWIKDNITLQISLHSLDDSRRNDLIPFKNKMSIKELGKIRTKSKLKTTLNLTLVDEKDFEIGKLKEYFDPEYFFIKLSPINKNECSCKNELGEGIIKSTNLV